MPTSPDTQFGFGSTVYFVDTVNESYDDRLVVKKGSIVAGFGVHVDGIEYVGTQDNPLDDCRVQRKYTEYLFTPEHAVEAIRAIDPSLLWNGLTGGVTGSINALINDPISNRDLVPVLGYVSMDRLLDS